MPESDKPKSRKAKSTGTKSANTSKVNPKEENTEEVPIEEHLYSPEKPKSTKSKSTSVHISKAPSKAEAMEDTSVEEHYTPIINASPRLGSGIFGIQKKCYQYILNVILTLIGTCLLFNQNLLLENQNTLIKHQMSLEEASRRSALVMLMSNIMDKVDKEIENQQKGLSESDLKKKRYKLSQSLIGQIAALSHSFKPYRYMSGDTLISRRLSPERGQLLITLALLPLDTSTLYEIYKSATFQEADLNFTKLIRANLSGVDLRFSDLSGARLDSADLSGANLNWVDMSGAILDMAKLDNAELHQADLSEALLSGAHD